jgi:SAM-dependent methyltransferase
MKKTDRWVPRACPVCSSRDESRVFAPDTYDPSKMDAFSYSSRKIPEYMHYRILECPTCDLLYSNPLPAEGTVSQSYLEAAFDAGEESKFAARTYGKILSKVMGSFAGRKGALDIGAGDGTFLEQLLDLGFSGVVGVEPSKAPIQAAAPRVKPLLRHRLFKAKDFKKGSLDLISCFQTLEHLYDPLHACRDAYSLLRPGGVYLTVCHNRRSFSAFVLGTKSPIFDIEHLQVFSPKSATEMLKRAGFSRVEVMTIYNRYPLYYWLKLVPFPRAWKTPLLEFLRQNAFGRMPVPLPAGNIAVVGFK